MQELSERNKSRLRAEQIRLLFSFIPASVLVTVSIACGMAFILWSADGDRRKIAGWLALTVATYGARYLLALRFKRANPPDEALFRWKATVSVLCGLSGVSWGLVLFIPDFGTPSGFLVLMLGGGVVVGALGTLSCSLTAYNSFIWPPMLMGAAWLLSHDGGSWIVGGLCVMALGAIVSFLGYRINHETRRALVLKFENLDLVRELEEAKEHILSLANHDSLTGLPNRRLLEEFFVKARADAERASNRLAVHFIDLDRFKPVNDRWGHRFGDRVLQAVGHRLLETMRGNDSVVRIGGDEFVVLQTGVADERDARVVSSKVEEALGRPLVVRDREIILGASIGTALYPDHGHELDALINTADKAMYSVKNGKKEA